MSRLTKALRAWGVLRSGERPHRRALLERLPKQTVGVEIGVWKGEFSADILRICRPSTLHLVDPWVFQPQYPARIWGGRIAKSQKEMSDLRDDVVAKFKGERRVRIHHQTSAAFSRN